MEKTLQDGLPEAFDLGSDAFYRDRHGYFKQFRETCPIFEQPQKAMWQGREFSQWVFTSYDDVAAILKSDDFIHEIQHALPDFEVPPLPEKFAVIGASQRNWLLTKDAPDHTRLRSLVSKAFTPRMVSVLTSRITEIAQSLLAQAPGEFDVVADLAFPLPVIVIAEMLGVPKEDRNLFKTWSNALIRTVDFNTSDEEYEAGNQAVIELRAYLKEIVSARRANPRDDLISGLVGVREAGGQLTEEELLDNSILLLVAGHETTVNLITNTVWLMDVHRDARSQLLHKPDLVAPAIEEVLRYESPVQLTGRLIARDMVYKGHELHAGDSATVVLASANRDASVFDQPDTFDISRNPNRHVGFGGGVHFCLGAPLARLEGQIALTEVLRHMPAYDVQFDAPTWRQSPLMRSMVELPVWKQ